MEKIINQSHDKNTLLFATSRLFERAGYYGLRSLIILYMIKESLFEEAGALELYGWFTASVIITRVTGALVGDLLIGNRRTIVLGGIIQSIGAFVLCIGNEYGVYAGLILVSVGSGFFTSNMDAQYGKLYLNKTKLLDSAFILLNMSINMGAFLGTTLIVLLGESSDWNLAFIVSGLCMLLAVTFYASSRKITLPCAEPVPVKYSKSAFFLVLILLCLALFWTASSLSQIDFSYFADTEVAGYNIKYFISMVKPLISIPIGLIVLFIWVRYYRNPLLKIVLGLLFGAVSFVLLYVLPEQASDSSLLIYVLAMIFLLLSELYTIPVLKGLIVRVANPKYLAIVLSVALLPSYYLIEYVPLLGIFFADYYDISILISVSISITFALVVYLFLYRRDRIVEK